MLIKRQEDVTPAVQTGQHVTPSTVIANMFDGGDGIETGWAQPTGVSAESELPEPEGADGQESWGDEASRPEDSPGRS